MTKEDLEPGAQDLIATFFWKPLLMPPFRHLNISSGDYTQSGKNKHSKLFKSFY